MSDPRKSKDKEQYIKNQSVAAVAVYPAAITIPAGGAGVVVNFSLPKHPISNAGGTDVGTGSDTSLEITAGDVFTTQVPFKYDAELANGEYYVDHLTGMGRGKKATSNVTMTWSYKIFELNVNLQPIDHPKKQSAITPSDDTDLTGIVTKGIMIFGLVSGLTATLNIQLENDSEAQALPFLSNGQPYIFYPGKFKKITATGTSVNGATIYGLGD